jgi:hypothetical protein
LSINLVMFEPARNPAAACNLRRREHHRCRINRI